MISRLFQKRNLEDPNTPIGNFTLLEVLGGGSRTRAGTRVSEETSKTISAVYAAVQTISGSVASLPIRVVQYRADGRSKDIVRDHPLHYLLNVEASEGISAISAREASMSQLLLTGTTVFDMPRNPRTLEIESLNLLDPMWYSVQAIRDGTRTMPVVVLRGGNGQKARALLPSEALRVCGLGGDGVTGWSVIKYARETFGAALAQEEYGARFFSNDATPRGVLEHPETLSPDAKSSLRDHWNGLYGGAENAHRVAVLEEGMKFNPVQINAEDSQFVETKKLTVRDVARWFNIPPHKIGDMADAKWANIDAQNLEYLQDTLTPWLTRWVQALSGQALTERERDATRLGFEFDFRELLRGDVKARSEYFNARFRTASITPNEIRLEEGENPIDGGDEVYVQSQYVPVSMLPDVIAAKVADDPEPDPDPEEEGSSRAVRSRSTLETRAFDARFALRASFLPDFVERGSRMARGEIREVRKLVDQHLDAEFVNAPAFREDVEKYYRESFPEFARGVWEAGFRAYAGAVFPQAVEEAPEGANQEAPTPEELESFATEYTEKAVNGMAAGARRRLQALSESDTPLSDVNAELESWAGETDVRSRGERVADRNTTELNEATALFVWAAVGVAFLVSRTTGESCPYCNAIDGTRVSMGEAFFEAGETLLPEGQTTPMKFSSRKSHPPYHQGCDCYLRPEA